MFRISSAEEAKEALDEARFNELAAESLDRRPTRSLARCAPCEASPRQRAIIFAALDAARGEGLTIPADQPLHGVAGDARMQYGETIHNRRTGELTVWLDVGPGVLPEHLAETVFHECLHVHDAVRGWPVDEPRAYDFAARMMAKHWPTLSGLR